MKILAVISFLAIIYFLSKALFYILAMKEPEKVKIFKSNKPPEFCIKVAGHGKDIHDDWKVVFSNDGFETEEDIQHTLRFDGGIICDYPVYQVKLFIGDKAAAIKFAEQFKTFEDCKQYNNKQKNIFDNLYAYRVANPCPEDPKIDKSDILINCKP